MKQISIVSETNTSLLAEVTEILAQQQINIESIDTETFAGHTVIILQVDNYDLTLKTIREIPAIHAVSEDALLIRLKNEPAALAKIARRFSEAQIAIRSMRFIERNEDYGLVAISTERTDEALTLVADVLVA